jgi:uncharacterized protein (DUF885 family)
MSRHPAAVLAAVLALAACAQGVGSGASPTTTAAAFDAEIDALTRDVFALNPESATSLGVPEAIAGQGYNARLSDLTPAGEAARRAQLADIVARVAAFDLAALDADRALTHEIVLSQAEASLGAAADTPYGAASLGFFMVYPLNHFASPASDIFQVMQVQQPLTSREDAEAYVARLEAFGPAFDGLLDTFAADAAAGAIPPDFVVARTRDVVASFLAPPAREHSLVTSMAERLTESGVDAPDLVSRAGAAMEDVVYPAYARLDAALAEIEPRTVHDAGIWRLPGGEALYDRLIRLHADSDLTADEVHDLGLAEVTRITAEMDAILRAQGRAQGSVAERMEALSADAEFLFEPSADGRAAIIAAANADVAAITPLLPDWFATLPPQPVEVRRVPEAIEASQARGYYYPPPLDGGAPGIFWINLRDTRLWPEWTVKTVTYHETVPGHHLQSALSLDQEDVPLLRKLYGVGSTAAFAEGWGLYAERLAAEMGMYADDPYSDLGRLQAELWRAVRLVVDTGMHAKRWSREEAIDYMIATGAVPERSDAIAEVERYVVLPGQALSYKLGVMKLVELRARAEAALGERFDIRTYHDAVLLDGGLPMPILERRLDAWIASQSGP